MFCLVVYLQRSIEPRARAKMATEGWCVGSSPTPEKWPDVFEGWKRVHSSSRAKMFRTVAGARCKAHEPCGQRFGGLAQHTQKAKEFRSHTTTHKPYTSKCACTVCLYSVYVLHVCVGGGTCARAASVLHRYANSSIQMTLDRSIDKSRPPR